MLPVRLSNIDFVVIFHVHPNQSVGVDFLNSVNFVWVSVGPLRANILAVLKFRAIKVPRLESVSGGHPLIVD